MAKSYEQISNHNANSQGKPDANLANDSNHLGGIPAEEYATKQYVQEYHQMKEDALKQYVDSQDASTLNSAKAYTDAAIRGQDFSSFAKLTDVQALDQKLTGDLNTGLNTQKNYTDSKVNQLTNDVNANFEDVENSIDQLNDNMQEVFQSVSSGKAKIAEAITDKGVTTSATASFDTMANNIENIETGGSEVIPPGYVDTSDATASANDILSGKIAYVDGQKIYGSLNFTGSNTPEYNPNNPYPELAQVELVYGDKESVASVTNLGNIGYTIFDISSDRNLLVGYNEDTHKIETMFRVGDQYMKSYNQHGELLSPEYDPSSLGITTDSDYTLCAIKMSCLNTSTTASAYECKIAILLAKTATVAKKNFMCYVFKISTKDGTIKATNNVVQIGDENCIEYNKWVIEGRRETVTTAVKVVNSSTGKVHLDYWDNAFLRWSPFSDTLAISLSQGANLVYLYRFLDYTQGATENYTTAVQFKDGFTEEYSIYAVDFCNNDRLVVVREGNTNTSIYIRVYSSNFSFIKQTKLSFARVVSYSGLYSFYQNQISSLAVDYVNGDVTRTELKTFDENYFYNSYCKGFSSRDDKYFVRINTSGFLSILKIDLDTLEVSEGYEGTTAFNYLFPLSDLKTFMAVALDGSSAGTVHLVETIPSGKELIGVKYNGEIFYKQIYRFGKLSATATDVATGKTFIGYQGVPETGTGQTASSSSTEEG